MILLRSKTNKHFNLMRSTPIPTYRLGEINQELQRESALDAFKKSGQTLEDLTDDLLDKISDEIRVGLTY